MLVQVQSKLIVILQRWMHVRICYMTILSASYASERSNSPPSKIRPTDFHFHAILQLSNKCNFSRPSMDRFSFQTKIEKFYQRYPRDRIINTKAAFLRKFRREKKNLFKLLHFANDATGIGFVHKAHSRLWKPCSILVSETRSPLQPLTWLPTKFYC